MDQICEELMDAENNENVLTLRQVVAGHGRSPPSIAILVAFSTLTLRVFSGFVSAEYQSSRMIARLLTVTSLKNPEVRLKQQC